MNRLDQNDFLGFGPWFILGVNAVFVAKMRSIERGRSLPGEKRRLIARGTLTAC
jgi:hypothetical protein